MNYKKWLIEDLQALERHRFAVAQLKSELETLEAEFTAIKATSYDKMPGGGGTNSQEEKLLTTIAKKQELEADLMATTLHVEDMDRVLQSLSEVEREVLTRMYIRQERKAAEGLAEELGFEVAQIYRLKNQALHHMAQSRFGVGYRT